MSQRSIPAARRVSNGVMMLALLALMALALFPEEARAQRVVMVHDEPHHRLVKEEGDLKLLDVQIIANDTTMLHTHSTPIFYTFISDGEGPTGGRVSSVTRYAEESFTHEVTNDGPNLFRIIALGHYGTGVPEGEADAPPTGMPTEPVEQNQWFRSYRIELDPGDETPTIQHSNPVVIIQVSEGHTDVSKEEGYGADLVKPADWTWRDAGSPYRLLNRGSTPVAVVVNEGRRPD